MNSKDETEVLMQEYGLFRQEIVAVLGFYKSHNQHLQVFSGGALALVGWLIKEGQHWPPNNHWWLWWSLPLVLTFVASHLVMTVADDLYGLILLGQRVSEVERRVNQIVERELLTWESKWVSRFFQSFRPVRDALNPNYFSAAFIVLVFVSLLFMAGWTYLQLIQGTSALRSVALVLGFIGCVTCIAGTGFVYWKVALKLRPAVARSLLRVPEILT